MLVLGLGLDHEAQVLGLGLGNEGQVLGLGLGFGLVLGLEISRPRTRTRTCENVRVWERLKSL